MPRLHTADRDPKLLHDARGAFELLLQTGVITKTLVRPMWRRREDGRWVVMASVRFKSQTQRLEFNSEDRAWQPISRRHNF